MRLRASRCYPHIRVGALLLAGALGMGGTCTIGPAPDDDDSALDQAAATVVVRENTGGTASVAAAIEDRFGARFELTGGQAVRVNGIDLSGPDGDDQYSATITAASSYTLTVVEPTRGVQDTALTSAGNFEITEPAAGATASLAGFTLRWSNADSGTRVTITLAQTLFGQQRTERFGPTSDSGAQAFSAADLQDFQQGAPITITITRTRETESVNGFRDAGFSTTATRTSSVNPGP